MVAVKWQVGVYLIHDFSVTTKEVYKFLQIEEKTYQEKQNKLLRKLLHVDDLVYKFKPQKLISTAYNDFTLFLYYRKHRKKKPDWKQFLARNVKTESSIHTDSTNMNESFVLFFFHKSSNKLYAVCGGYGSVAIKNFTNEDFGIDILMRILQTKGNKVLRHAKEFGITGGLVGVAKYFRENYNFYENTNFGNIYREVSAEIDKDIIRSLSIDTNDVKQCIAKNSFKINQSITYENMLSVVDKLNVILEREANFNINDIKKIDSRKENTLIDKLEEVVLNQLWEGRNNFEILKEQLDFINKKFDRFSSSDYFLCNGIRYEDKKTIFVSVMNSLSNPNKKHFFRELKTKTLRGYDSEGEELISDKVFNHLVLEIQYESQNYFLINGEYYEINSSFINTLNESCKDFISNNYYDGLDKNWNSGRESVYNLLYKGETDTLVLDTITPDNIEACDILKFDSQKVYFCHVKKGFDGSMRDLTNQVFVSASRIIEDLKSDKTYLKNLYEKLQNSEEYRDQVDSEDEFLSIFENKKLCFVLAVKDTATNERSISCIESFSSNIAKFSLNELVNKMRNIGIEFQIAQINQ